MTKVRFVVPQQALTSPPPPPPPQCCQYKIVLACSKDQSLNQLKTAKGPTLLMIYRHKANGNMTSPNVLMILMIIACLGPVCQCGWGITTSL